MIAPLKTILDKIFAGYVVRTKEEMKHFESLVGKHLHYTLIERKDAEDLFQRKYKKAITQKIEEVASSVRNCCRFCGEMEEEELHVKIEVALFESGDVCLLPENFFSAIIARMMQNLEAASFLNFAFEVADKYLFPSKEKESEE